MRYYLVRVELDTQDATALYPALQEKMEKVGFSSVIEAADGAKYRLPGGTWVVPSELNAGEVKDIARQVARTVGKNWVFVMAAGDWAGYLDVAGPSKSESIS